MDANLMKLIEAARRGDLDEVKNTVSPENLNAEGPLGMTVLGEACRAEQTEVVKFLLKAGADVGDYLNLSCEYKDVHSVNLLIASGINLDNYDKYGKAPLHIAVERQSEVIVGELLKHGASVNKVDRQHCRTPLHMACEYENLIIVKLLLDSGACLDLKDTSSRTPLHTACTMNKSTDVLLALVSHGALMNEQQDRFGDTPLHIACDRGRPDMARILLRNGASVNTPNRRRLTPLHIALLSRGVTSIILDYGAGSTPCALYGCPCKASVFECQYNDCHSDFTSIRHFDRHIIKLQKAGIHYAQIIRHLGSKDSKQPGHLDESFSAECEREIEKMKALKFQGTNSTYYDLLYRKRSALQNHEIIDHLSLEVLKEFPIYGDMIYCSYLKIPEFIKWRESIDKCSSFFKLTSFGRLPEEIVHLILEHLKQADLDTLIKICGTCRLQLGRGAEDGQTRVVAKMKKMSITDHCTIL